MIRVSVLLLAYNHERYIQEAIDGVLGQKTAFNYELIVVDGGSSDGTNAIIESYAAAHPATIRFVPATATDFRRRWVDALKNARGTYVAVLDGDDYWTAADKLQVEVDFLDRHPSYAFVFHDVDIQSPGQPPRHSFESRSKPILTFDDLLLGNVVTWSSTMFRSAVIATIPDWYADTLCGDWAFCLLNAQHGPAGYIDRVMGVYRYHGRGAWSGLEKEKQFEELIAFTNLFAEKFDLQGSPLVRKAMAKHYALLAVEHRKSGRREEAKRAAGEALRNDRLAFFRLAAGWTRPSRFAQRAWRKLRRVLSAARARDRA